jgi:hypothetical protein
VTLFELRYRKEPLKMLRGVWVTDPVMADLLPDRPPQFDPMVGTYRDVARRAVYLNEAQTRSGFRHYLFFPEPHGGTPCRCDFCREHFDTQK